MCQGNTIGPVQVIIGEFLDYLTILSDLSSWWNITSIHIYVLYLYKYRIFMIIWYKEISGISVLYLTIKLAIYIYW